MNGTEPATTGRVVRTDAKVCHVEIDGRIVVAVPRGRLFEQRGPQKNPVAVGDFVRLDLTGEPAGLDEVLPRRNWLGRLASMHDPREQVLVSNIDRLYVVGSLGTPKFSSNRTDRILAACAWYQVPAALVINKLDLDKGGEADAIRATYEGAGYEVLGTSVVKSSGIDALRDRLKDKVSAFYGGSGVGKSSLLNALQPELALKVGKISKYWTAGKHTTSSSQLHRLSFGGWVADTPGVRTFKLHGASPGELRLMFLEFERFQGACRFPDCTHDHEPDCAVFAAVERGQIAASRYASYVEMLDELRTAPATDAGAPEPGDEDA
jgi:ribosome biogenesis GTPase / thiamine phosphate phosphatase